MCAGRIGGDECEEGAIALLQNGLRHANFAYSTYRVHLFLPSPPRQHGCFARQHFLINLGLLSFCQHLKIVAPGNMAKLAHDLLLSNMLVHES